MNTSPTDRTPGAGRHAYLSAGIASLSARNLLCSVSRSITNRLRTSSAASRFGTSCAAAGRATAGTTTTDATNSARRSANDARPVTSAYRMLVYLLAVWRGWVDCRHCLKQWHRPPTPTLRNDEALTARGVRAVGGT